MFAFGFSLGQKTMFMADYPEGYSIADASDALGKFIEDVKSNKIAKVGIISDPESLDKIILKWTMEFESYEGTRVESVVGYVLTDTSISVMLISVDYIDNGKDYKIEPDEAQKEFRDIYDLQSKFYLDTFFETYLKLKPSVKL